MLPGSLLIRARCQKQECAKRRARKNDSPIEISRERTSARSPEFCVIQCNLHLAAVFFEAGLDLDLIAGIGHVSPDHSPIGTASVSGYGDGPNGLTPHHLEAARRAFSRQRCSRALIQLFIQEFFIDFTDF